MRWRTVRSIHAALAVCLGLSLISQASGQAVPAAGDSNSTPPSAEDGLDGGGSPPEGPDGVLLAAVAEDVIEDFESATWPHGNWQLVANFDTGFTSPAAALHGERGYYDASSNGGWYRLGTSFVGKPGDVLRIYTRFTTPTGARSYLGFGATAAGAQSLVFAPNSGLLMFQRNPSYDFENLNSVAISVSQNVWYRLDLTFINAQDVVGSLYDVNGTTLLATVSQTYPEGLTPGNLVIRAFGGNQLDSLSEDRIWGSFRCWEAFYAPMERVRVRLRDSITDQIVELQSPSRFCNPTLRQDGSLSAAVLDTRNHLTWYRIRNPAGRHSPRKLLVTNDFGEQVVTIAQPMFLAVPTEKVAVNGVPVANSQFPTDLDHFICYYARPTRFIRSVGLRDQFDEMDGPDYRTARVHYLAFLCVPADVLLAPLFQSGPLAQSPDALLLCYATSEPGNRRVSATVSNQFADGVEQRLSDPRMVCLPSSQET